MGTYLNPGNAGFTRMRKGDYRDKSGLISLINDVIGTDKSLICISRPRRFGKSYAAQMLCAYYDCTCDSHKLFNDLVISKNESYEEHINKYEVIYLDIAAFLSKMKSEGIPVRTVVSALKSAVRTELVAAYPELADISDATDCMLKLVDNGTQEVSENGKFVFIIDEWDAVIREAKDDEKTQISYLNLLREWFKNGNFTGKAVAAAYMTGILPIKKDGSQSAISDFREYPILNPGKFAEYTGFTETDVRELCKKYDMEFEDVKRWYDGYSFAKVKSVYNPYSVMMAMDRGEVESYWKKTSAAENLLTYIDVNISSRKSELHEKILKLIAGEHIKVDVDGFQNDFQTFKSDDDVLTLLIHLGYLAYDKTTKRVRIPNEEVRGEFDRLLKKSGHPKLNMLLMNSKQILSDTLAGNSVAVAKSIKKVREMNYAPQYYNNEQALRYTIKFAYIICVDDYMKIEELATGKGLADIVYLPKSDSAFPAMIVELKWEETAEAAIDQIKRNNYPAILADYCGEIVLVGINYNSKTNEHTCQIERITK